MTETLVRSEIAARGPWKGLAPYDDSSIDAQLFFGRDREVEVACANLTASRLTVLFGASGVGKSSLLRAGVVRRLREQGGGETAAAIVSSWAGDPLQAVAAAAHAAVEEALGRSVEDPGGSLAARVRAWTDELGGELYLLLDQVEEYFLYHQGGEGAGSFAAEFPALVTERGLRVHVLLGIREDSLGLLDAFRAAVPGVLSNYLRLERLDRHAGRAAILGPIARWSELAPDEDMTAEPELVEAVLDEVAAGLIEPDAGAVGGVTPSALVERIEAPYLQLVLERLWEIERGEGSSVLRRETLRRLGGSGRIVEEHLERSLSSLDADQRDGAAALFTHLVTPSGTKIAHRVDDLASYASLDARRAAALVATLQRERILRPADGGRVEIYHDVLAAAVGEWRRDYDSRRALEQQRRQAEARHRRLLAILGGAIAALTLVAAVAVYALTQRSEAREQAARAEQQAEVAREQRANAEEQTAIARAERTRAERQAQIATRRRTEAQRQTRIANEQRAEARRQEASASANAKKAREQAALAAASEEDAREQAAIANRERRAAARQETIARRQTRIARANEQLARARELAALAEANITVDPLDSVLFALEAARRAPQLDVVEDVLRKALIEMRVRVILEAGSPLNRASFSPDGSFVLTAGAGGDARIFRRSTGALVHRLRHAPTVHDAVFSPDGRTIATAGGNGRVLLWSADSGAQLRALRHGGPVRTVEFSRDGRLLVTAADDGTARLWDPASGLELHALRHPQAVKEARLSPDGRLVATFTGDSFVRVFDAGSGTVVATPQQPGEVTDVAWSPSGSILGSAGRRNGFLWSTSTWERLALLEGHSAPIRAIVFSPDGARVVTTSVDSTSRLYQVSMGTLLYSIGTQRSTVTSAAFSPDGRAVATGSIDKTARTWSQERSFGASFVGHIDTVTSVAFSPDGRAVLTASLDGQARLWDPEGEPTMPELGRHEGGATAAAFSPDGSLVVSSGADGVARIWRRRGGLVATLPHEGRVNQAAFVARGRLVLTASEDGRAALWRSDGTNLAFFGHGSPVTRAAATLSGSLVATGGTDGIVRIWRRDGTAVRALVHRDAVTSVAFSPDDSLLLSASADSTARIWRVSDGGMLALLPHDDRVGAAAWSRDGRRIVTGSDDHSVRIWMRGGATLHRLVGHADNITSVVFSSDGKLVLAADRSGDGRIWDLDTGGFTLLRGHIARVSDAQFSPDGRWVVTAGPSAAGLWQTRTGHLLFFFRGHTAPLTTASFSRDGRWLLTSSADGSVRRYRCVICGNLRQLVAVANARLRLLRS